MVELQDNLEVLESAGIQLVGISYDNVDTLKTFSQKNRITFPLLSDHFSRTKNQTIHGYHVFDPREKGKYSGVPVPTTMIIDRSKTIRMVLPGTITKRHSIGELIEKVKKL